MSKAHDAFWLAHYAHRMIQPVVDEANKAEGYVAKLQFHIEPAKGSIDIWTYHNREGVPAYQLNVKRKAQIDSFAVRLDAAFVALLSKGTAQVAA